jgi:hypothetical protein
MTVPIVDSSQADKPSISKNIPAIIASAIALVLAINLFVSYQNGQTVTDERNEAKAEVVDLENTIDTKNSKIADLTISFEDADRTVNYCQRALESAVDAGSAAIGLDYTLFYSILNDEAYANADSCWAYMPSGY